MNAATQTDQAPLLQITRFRRFALAKACNQLAQNALIYGLFIIVVEEQDSALATSAFVLTGIVPSIVLSLPGGLIADTLPRKLTIVATLAARLVIAGYFIQFDSGLAPVLLLTLATRSVVEFYGTAESVALLAVVPNERMGSASALLNAVSLGAQIVGAGIAAPLLLKAFNDDALFIFVLVLLAASLLLFLAVPELTSRHARQPLDDVRFVRRLFRGWRLIRASRTLFWITTFQVLIDSALLMVVVAVPAFITDVLRTNASNAVYIFAPSAAGVAVGLLVTPGALKIAPPRVLVAFGVAIFVAAVLALPFVNEIARELEQRTFLPFDQARDTFHIRRAIATTALIAPFGALGITVVRVAARTGVYLSAAENTVGQVFATQSALTSVAALLPTVCAGLLVDAAGAQAALVITGGATATIAALALAGPFGDSRVMRE